MKTTINKEEWKRVVSEAVEVDIPERQMYFWHNGERIAYCVTPVWTSWNKEHYNKEEEIWELKVVKVDPDPFEPKMETYSLRVSEFTRILDTKRNDPNYRLVDNILFHPDEDTRTKEQFLADYEKTLEAFKNNLS